MTWNRIRHWLEERVDFSEARHLIKEKSVPVHQHSAWYYFGGMTLFFFLVQLGTGILLMLYYRPSSQEAYESVQFIMTQVPFGWLIRSIHSWSANLMIGAAFVHLFSVFFLKSYRKPRELAWLSGVILFVLAMGFGFSGYLLPWNKLSYFATKVGTEIAGSIPGVGHGMLRFLRGGDHVTGGTLSRFYGWHVAILPAITLFLLIFHLLQVQKHGMSVPPGLEKKAATLPKMPFVHEFLLRDLFLKSVPGGAALGIENEVVAILGFGLLGLILFLVPFLDRDLSRPGKFPLFRAGGAVALTGIVTLTAIGYRAWWPPAAALVLVFAPWLAGRAMARGKGGRA